MRVLVTGASGWVGSLVVRDLRDAGHEVVGLVRSVAKGEALGAIGATPLIGSLDDLALLRRGAGDADAVVHTAFGTALDRIAEASEVERRAIAAMGEALLGSDRPIVVTGGIALAPRDRVIAETDAQPVMPDFPRYAEQAARSLVERGVRCSVVRLP